MGVSDFPAGVVRLTLHEPAGDRHVDLLPRLPEPENGGNPSRSATEMAESLRNALQGSGLGFSVEVLPTIAAAWEGSVTGELSAEVVDGAWRMVHELRDALALAPQLIPQLINDPATWAALRCVAQHNREVFQYEVQGEGTASSTERMSNGYAAPFFPLYTVRGEPLFLYDVLQSPKAVSQLEIAHARSKALAATFQGAASSGQLVLADAAVLARLVFESALVGSAEVGGVFNNIVRNLIGGQSAELELLEEDTKEGGLMAREVDKLTRNIARLAQTTSELLKEYRKIESALQG